MYRLSVLNRTSHVLFLSGLENDTLSSALVLPSCNQSFSSSRWSTFAHLQLGFWGPKKSFQASNLRLKKTISHSKSVWALLTCHPPLPCLVYKLKLSHNHYQLIIFPKRTLSSYLADLPSSLSLSSLMLPGTHNSVAFYGWPISQCQDLATPLAIQFARGIRVLDIRLSVINGVLISYHGIYSQKIPFTSIVQAVYTFLTSSEGKNETIVMSIKQEDQASTLFSQLVHNAVHKGSGKDMWFLKNRVPILGEVRGKVVLLSRFGGNGQGWEGGLEGLGIHPSTWPDSKPEGFEWWLKGTKVKTHDWYSIPSFLAIPEKAAKASRILLQPTPQSFFPVLSITFLSAASFPLALPPLVACGFGWPSWGLGVEGVNSRVGKWILGLLSESDDKEARGGSVIRKSKSDRKGYRVLEDDLVKGEPRLRGWCLVDYFQDPSDVGLVQLLVECNYRGRKSGEEGWP